MTTHNVKLTSPWIDIHFIPKDQFIILPAFLQSIASSYDHCNLVTITPKKSPDSGLCRVTMVVPHDLRGGNVLLQNNGRVPSTAPAPDQDDLRPETFYAFGKGTQAFKVVLDSDHTNFINSDFTVA